MEGRESSTGRSAYLVQATLQDVDAEEGLVAEVSVFFVLLGGHGVLTVLEVHLSALVGRGLDIVTALDDLRLFNQTLLQALQGFITDTERLLATQIGTIVQLAPLRRSHPARAPRARNQSINRHIPHSPRTARDSRPRRPSVRPPWS